MLDLAKPYTVELHLSRSIDDSIRAGRFDLELVDRERGGTKARPGVGIAFFDLRAQIIAGIDLPVGRFLDGFLSGDGGTQEDGLRFGQHLLERLLSDAAVRVLWNEIQARRKAAKRPLRLELILPADDAGVVSDMPFELLADESGFLFRQVGATLVRVIQRLPVRAAEIAPGDAVLVAWANPGGDNRLPQALFDRHEESTHRAAEKAGLSPKAPCRRATLAALEERLVEGNGTPVVSLIAHGDPGGGAAWLHRSHDPAFPDDLGQPIEARDLAHAFRLGGVRLALLWTCHGGKHNTVAGALATTLLQEEHGDVAAVVASHAALRAESTAAMVERLFGSLQAPAGGDVERAVAEARLALAETDLQWAAPVYYARPDRGRSVTLAEALKKAAESLGETEPPRAGVLARAPGRWPHFRGRDDEVTRGLSYLRTGRLVSVTGMAGMGKTEVALEIAREAANDYTRALWLGLDAMSTVESLRALLASAFGAEPKDCPDDAALGRRIGDTHALVVLDNAEDLIRADRAAMQALCGSLLRECPRLSLLLATRERLGAVRAAEEHDVHIGKLREADARAVFLSVAAERLTLEDRNAPDLSHLITWLDGHPLSLVLVAKQVGTMTLAALLRRLETRGADAVHAAELFGEEPTSDPGERLTRLVASLNLSYRPLAEKAPDAAEMFAWLGHFPAGVPDALVPLVFGEEGAERRAILLRRGLADEVGREKRLVLPAPVRAYARARAEELATERARELAVKSFEALGSWLTVLLNQLETRTAREALAIAAQDVDNADALLRVVEASSIRTEFAEHAGPLVDKVAYAMHLLGKTVDYNGQAERLSGILGRAKTVIEHLTGPGRPLASVLAVLGETLFFAADLDAAEHAYTRALAMYADAGDALGRANMLTALGEVHMRHGRSAQAKELWQQAVRIFDATKERLGAANVRTALGRLCLATDRPGEAEAHLQQAMVAYQETGSSLGEANVHKAMGDIYARFDRPEEAERSYCRALPLYEAVGHRLQEANLHRSLGELYFHTARLESAEASFQKALIMYDAIGEQIGWANTKVLLGTVYEHRGHLIEAEEALRAAIAVQHKTQDMLGRANSYKLLGSLFAHAEQHAKAESAYDEAARLAVAFGDRHTVANVITQRAGLYADMGRGDESESAYKDALSTYRSIGGKLGEANCLVGMSGLALRRGELLLSHKLAAQAMGIYREAGETWGVASAIGSMARAVFLMGDTLRAAALMAEVRRLRDEKADVRDEVLALMFLTGVFEDLGMADAADAAGLLALSRAASIAVDHPYAVEIAAHVRRKPPSAAEAFHLQIVVKAAITSCAQEFAKSGGDLYAAPLLDPSQT